MHLPLLSQMLGVLVPKSDLAETNCVNFDSLQNLPNMMLVSYGMQMKFQIIHLALC